MKKSLILFIALLMGMGIQAREFNKIPVRSKWISAKEVIYSYDGSFEDSLAFSVNAVTGRRNTGVAAPEKFTSFPVHPEGFISFYFSL